jgi:pyruvate dehydrogenase E1 component
MLFDGFFQALPDIDPTETDEWVQSYASVVERHGKRRGQFLIRKLMVTARDLQVDFPATVSTPYLNTIPPEAEPWFPGDADIENRIRAYIRWNAVAMVTTANSHADGIGGHLSTFASSASL